MIMLGLAVLLFFPALGAGELFGNPVKGNVNPVSMSVMIGAFIFGIGMQLGVAVHRVRYSLVALVRREYGLRCFFAWVCGLRL